MKRILAALLVLFLVSINISNLQASNACANTKNSTIDEHTGALLGSLPSNPSDKIYEYPATKTWTLTWKDYVSMTATGNGMGNLGTTGGFCANYLYCHAAFKSATFVDQDKFNGTAGVFDQDFDNKTYNGHDSSCNPVCYTVTGGTIHSEHTCGGGD